MGQEPTIIIKIYYKIKGLVLFFMSANWQMGALPFIKLFAAVFSLFLFVLIIVLTIRSDKLWKMKLARESANVVGFPKHFDKRWQMVLRRMAKGDEANMKLAVIEADRLLDVLLKHMRLPGNDMGERLQQLTPVQLSNLDDIWAAHKIRNSIVHDADNHLTRDQAESAIAAYEKAFKEWEVL